MTGYGDAFADVRAREFAWPRTGAYLNAASSGPLPARARDAIADFHMRRWQALLTDPDLVAPLVASREAAARLINVTADEIALVPNTNVGLNVAASAVAQLAKRKRVVVHDREFPANVYPWLALERQGFQVDILPGDERGFPREDALIERICAGDVGAVSVSFVQFSTGYRSNLAKIADACRATGTLFVVDAIQGLGAVPLDARALEIDVLACGAQKWLCSPWGSGFAYVRRDLITKFELDLPGWLAFEATQDFTQLTNYRYDFVDTARRFETGSLGFQDFVGFSASVELLLELGVTEIWQHIRALQQPLIDWAVHNQIEIVSDLSDDRRSGILCIRPPRAEAAHAALAEAQVRCALREGAIRVSPHWYNTHDHIAALTDVLDRHLGK